MQTEGHLEAKSFCKRHRAPVTSPHSPPFWSFVFPPPSPPRGGRRGFSDVSTTAELQPPQQAIEGRRMLLQGCRWGQLCVPPWSSPKHNGVRTPGRRAHTDRRGVARVPEPYEPKSAHARRRAPAKRTWGGGGHARTHPRACRPQAAAAARARTPRRGGGRH